MLIHALLALKHAAHKSDILLLVHVSSQVTNILLLVHVPKGQNQLLVLRDFREEHMGTPRQQELLIPPGYAYK
jgi:hypothetical protein